MGIWLLWLLLTSVRSHQRLLPDALSLPVVCCLIRSQQTTAIRCAEAWSSSGLTAFRDDQGFDRYVEQISPNKNMNFSCTTAAFTLSPVPGGFVILCPLALETKPSMRFLSVSSQLCARASFTQSLTGLHLPSASSYHHFNTKQWRYSYRGL